MKNLKQIYLLLFIVGTIVPYYFVINFILQSGFDVSLFINQLFSTFPSGNFVSDLIISIFVFWVFIWFDSKNKKIPHLSIFVLLTLFVGLSSALPLYLYFREDNNK
jgi:hypothetical protein